MPEIISCRHPRLRVALTVLIETIARDAMKNKIKRRRRMSKGIVLSKKNNNMNGQAQAV